MKRIISRRVIRICGLLLFVLLPPILLLKFFFWSSLNKEELVVCLFFLVMSINVPFYYHLLARRKKLKRNILIMFIIAVFLSTIIFFKLFEPYLRLTEVITISMVHRCVELTLTLITYMLYQLAVNEANSKSIYNRIFAVTLIIYFPAICIILFILIDVVTFFSYDLEIQNKAFQYVCATLKNLI